MYIVIYLLIITNIIILWLWYQSRKKYQENNKLRDLQFNKMKFELERDANTRTDDLEKKFSQIKQSEGQFREAFETAMLGMALLSLDGSFKKVNTSLCDMLGYNEDELLRTDLQCITPPDDFIDDHLNMERLIHGKLSNYQHEKRLYHMEGLTAWVLQNMTLVRDIENRPVHFAVQFIDITERRQAEDQLKKYSETLTVLLREVNHRVKNNLAALISMLHMEQNKASIMMNEGYIEFLNDLINRIQSLSTVHSMLSAQNWQPLEISDLCNQVIRAATHGTPPGKKINILITPTDIKLNSNQSHHLTLVINELTTNSIKHAIHKREHATITVDISSVDNFITIKFKDDGPGFPQALIEGDFTRANIGFELIRGIVIQSLDGEFRLENQQGATAIIRFQNEIDEI